MRPSLFFAAFEPLQETPQVCDICNSNPPVLCYEFATYGTRGEAKEKKGFCCAHCTTILARMLGRDESQRWAEEEAALKADEFDVSDFRQHRLAAFRGIEESKA
jgi:hypothetical protein